MWEFQKFHLCTAMRTVMSMHVAEILRDAGPKVVLGPIIDFKLYPTLYRENLWQKSLGPPNLTTENWVGLRINVILSVNNSFSSNPPPPCNELYIYRGVPRRICQ